MNRLRSLNIALVLYVFRVMLFAGIATSALFFILYSAGFLPFLLFTPILAPFAALLASGAIGTSIAALASERVLKPLNELIKATASVAAGDYSVRVTERDDESEMGELLRNFNRMAGELGSIELFRRDFIDDFSHELKTPIISIRGFAKQLENEDLPLSRRKEYAEIIVRESERLCALSSNVLLIAKLKNQGILVGRTEYELDEQIRNCVILLEKAWMEKGIDIELGLEPLRILANEELMSQVWINLLDNAIKFSEPGGRIWISCASPGGRIEVRFRDEGIGMSEETRLRAFDEFFQGEVSRSGRGCGLGLSIVKRIVELHGGEIVAESEIGRGTTFIARLDRYPQ